jgi:putative endonuclease
MAKAAKGATKRLNLPPGAGKAGEAAALSHLRRLGYEVLRTNYRVREGEVDVIARHRGQLVFVEVKTRRNAAFGTPEESLTETKQRRLVAAAQSYLAEAGMADADWRIDFLAIELDAAGRVTRAEVIENAVDE